jgi:hypothetical protein
MCKELKRNSQKFHKHMQFYLMITSELPMITQLHLHNIILPHKINLILKIIKIIIHNLINFGEICLKVKCPISKHLPFNPSILITFQLSKIIISNLEHLPSKWLNKYLEMHLKKTTTTNQ